MTVSNYGTFQPDELMPLIPSLFLPGTFLQTMFFGSEVVEFDTEEVYFDRILDDRRRAPYVADLAPAKARQPRGYRKENIVPAAMKEKHQITGKEVLSRLPGERIGGEISAADREAAIREMYLIKHREYFVRTHEYQASSLLRTGSMTIVGDQYPSQVVNFGRNASQTKQLLTTARWGESGVSPYDDADAAANEVGEASGSAVDTFIMDRLAWALYKADPKTEKALDTTLGQTAAVTLGFTPTVPGAPAFKGRDGNVEIYVYNDIQDNADFTATEKLLPDYTFIPISRAGIAGGKLCGVIQHAENHYEPNEFFPHEWIDSNTGAQWVETITKAILAPRRINASACWTVR